MIPPVSLPPVLAVAPDLHRYFSELFSGRYDAFAPQLPSCYLVLDVETSGLSPRYHAITQLGMCFVCDGKIEMCAGSVLQVDPGTVFEENAVRITGITPERCRREGVPRREFFNEAFALVDEMRLGHNAVVGHNLWRFDNAFLTEEAARMRRSDFALPENIYDTGLLFKAAQLKMFPAGENRHEFYAQVDNYRARGVLWNLQHAAKQFGVSHGQAHDAGADALVTQRIFERIRTLGRQKC